jgi:hypothetical protein
MTEAESYSEHIERTGVEKRAFLPTAAELLVLGLFSLLFLILINSVTVYKTIDGQSSNMLSDILSRYSRHFGSFVDDHVSATAITFIVWMFIGIGVYTLLWLGAGLLHIYSDEHVETKGRVLPKNFNAAVVLRESVVRILIRLLAVVCLVSWLYFALSNIVPRLSSVFLNDIVRITPLTLISAIWTSMALGLTVFVIFVLARCIVLRDRVFNK